MKKGEEILDMRLEQGKRKLRVSVENELFEKTCLSYGILASLIFIWWQIECNIKQKESVFPLHVRV